MARSNVAKNDSASEKKRERNIFGRFVYSKTIEKVILTCIVLNSIQLGLDTTQWWQSFAGGFSRGLDAVFIWIFAIEIILKLLADKHRFFSDGWNIFDFTVVAVAFIPGNGVFSVLRVFRIFRALRLFYRIPRLRIITESLFSSIPSIGWLCILLCIWFYICSVVCTSLFGTKFPNEFGSIGRSMYSLFQIMTLESWSSGIARPVMEKFPYAWVLFVPFIIFATYTVLNLFIGIMVDAISEAQAKRIASGKSKDPNAAILQELQKVHEELRALKSENHSIKVLLARSKKRS